MLEHLQGLEEAQSWVGSKLDELDGGTVGRVEGAFVDSRDGDPTWLIIRIGRFGRRSAVPFELAAGGVGHVWVPFPKETIRSAPEVDPAAGLDRGSEIALCEHYGIVAGAPRHETLAGREDGEPTSIPAPE
jgi:hypothetical protein